MFGRMIRITWTCQIITSKINLKELDGSSQTTLDGKKRKFWPAVNFKRWIWHHEEEKIVTALWRGDQIIQQIEWD